MAEPREDPQLSEALEELQLYFSDSIPPLVAAGSVELLTKQPVELVASAIDRWIGAQYRRGQGASVPLSDYLFHAVKKIQLMQEYRLVGEGTLLPFLEELKAAVLARCPAEDRELLTGSLTRLGEASAGSAPAPAASLFRQISVDPAPAVRASSGAAAPSAGAEAGALRRFSAFLERLEADAHLPGGTRAPSSDTLAAAARRSDTAGEIEQYLEKLRGQGLAVGTADVFQALAKSLPAWAPPATAAEWRGGEQSKGVEAMRKMIAEAPDPGEGARRFQELIRAAVDRFNEGSLPQAVATLELADNLVAERKVDSATVDVARRRGDQDLDQDRLRHYSENASLHASLRAVLRFFSGLAPGPLLDELRRETKRDRRRSLLTLLEVHGETARAAALEQLAGAPAGNPEESYYRRNLLYLVRRIPRPPSVSVDEEIAAAARHADPTLLPALVKEAVTNLSQIKEEKSALVLKDLLSRLEDQLARPEEAPQDPKELMSLLDRTAAALAKMGVPGARDALVEHAVRRDPKLGDTMARLAELSGHDLREEPALVSKLVELVRSNLPVKVLGLVLHQNDQNAVRAIEALSGTPAPDVQAILEEVASRFPGKEVGRAATRALGGFRKAALAPAPTSASLTGDLEVFGLPALLQSLSDSAHSGSLTLIDSRGGLIGTIRLKSGKFRSCRAGSLRGKEALYQLLERPSSGNFQFTRTDEADPDASSTGTLLEVLPIVLEGMRRNDELREATALVPDDARLQPTATKPTPYPGESDGMLTKNLWSQASQGATARECEAAIATDSYRIRKLLAHWVEGGALKVVRADASK